MSRLRPESTLSDDAAAPFRFGVVVSRFNAEITEALLEGALEALDSHGAREERVVVVRVPGAFELPVAAARLARGDGMDAVVCLGALVRGETTHFDWLAASVSHGVQEAALESGVPITFGVLTCENLDQARARSGGDHGNKGTEAALAAIEMAVTCAGLEEAG